MQDVPHVVRSGIFDRLRCPEIVGHGLNALGGDCLADGLGQVLQNDAAGSVGMASFQSMALMPGAATNIDEQRCLWTQVVVAELFFKGENVEPGWLPLMLSAHPFHEEVEVRGMLMQPDKGQLVGFVRTLEWTVEAVGRILELGVAQKFWHLLIAWHDRVKAVEEKSSDINHLSTAARPLTCD